MDPEQQIALERERQKRALEGVWTFSGKSMMYVAGAALLYMWFFKKA